MDKSVCKLQVYGTGKANGGVHVYAVYDLRDKEWWNLRRMEDRGLLKGFLSEDNLKESLNWYLNGDSKKYKMKKMKSNGTIEYVSFIYD